MPRRLRSLVTAVLCAAALATASSATAAPLPVLVPVDGLLLSAGGGPTADGDYALQLKVYDGPDANAQTLHTEIHLKVAVTQGRFRVLLGSADGQPGLPIEALTSVATPWLGISIAGEPELPRVPMHPVPSALRAAVADLATTAQTANQATVALAAQGLQCTGCVGLDAVTDSVLAAANHKAFYNGQPASVQVAISGLDSRLAAREATLVVSAQGDVGLNVQQPTCAMDVGEACQDGLPSRMVLHAKDEAEMLTVQGEGKMVFREDTQGVYVQSDGVWRQLRYMPYCGDGIIEGDEECDDGKQNGDVADACRLSCKNPVCGDSIKDTGEACDDGNLITEDDCVPGCKFASCGDGFVHQGVEECDDGNQDNTDACVAGCKNNVCGDGYVQNGVEDCDDGNLNPGDGCDAQCKSECSGLCTNGTCTDCNTNGGTLVASSAFVDKNPPGGWTQCFGFINTSADDVSPTAIDNCLGATKLRLRIWDTNDTLRVDVSETGLSGKNSWWSSGAYFDSCNCGAALTMHKCEADMWPCGNNAGFYGSNGGKGGGGCSGYASGGMTVSNGNGGQVTVGPAQAGAQELWKGPCYGNTTYVGYKVAIYK